MNDFSIIKILRNHAAVSKVEVLRLMEYHRYDNGHKGEKKSHELSFEMVRLCYDETILAGMSERW